MSISVKDIDALLPQTQCQECGFAGCLPYAEALAQDSVSIDKCPPGGTSTLTALANLLGKDVNAYLQKGIVTRAPTLAVIIESECIGCTKCIQACPVDAIIGTSKAMHAVIGNECTGCGLCVEPCPVDCIEMLPVSEPLYNKSRARERFKNKQIRLLREQHTQQQSYREKKQLVIDATNLNDKQAKKDYILEALARSRVKNK